MLAYCWRCETPLSNTETRMDDVYRDRQDPALTVGFELLDGPLRRCPRAGLDDHAVDAAGQPRPRRRPRHRLRRRRARRRARTCWPPSAWPPTPPSSAPAPRSGGHASRAPTSSAPRVPPAVRLLHRRRALRHRAGVPGPRRRLRVDRGRHRRSSTWRPASARTTRWPATPSASRRSCRWTSTAGTRPRSRPWAGEHVFDANPPRHPPPQGRAASSLRHETYDHPLPALLALRPAARLPGHLVVVRRGHQVPRPHGRAQRADHVGARAPQARQLRQVAAERPRLVDQPQPLLGLADPGVAQRRPDVPARRRLRLARRAGGRLRRAPSPTCTARSSTSSCGPTPTTRPGAR